MWNPHTTRSPYITYQNPVSISTRTHHRAQRGMQLQRQHIECRRRYTYRASTARGNSASGRGMCNVRLTLYGPRSSTMQMKTASRPTETVRLFNGLPNLGKSVTRNVRDLSITPSCQHTLYVTWRYTYIHIYLLTYLLSYLLTSTYTYSPPTCAPKFAKYSTETRRE